VGWSSSSVNSAYNTRGVVGSQTEPESTAVLCHCSRDSRLAASSADATRPLASAEVCAVVLDYLSTLRELSVGLVQGRWFNVPAPV
jgi:hypothetical protein